MNKIFNNFDISIVKIIGIKYYILYICFTIFSITKILKSKKLTHVDFLMGKTSIKKFKFNKKIVFFDCNYVDRHIKENNYSFGLIRELFFRDVYLKFIPTKKLSEIQTTIDLGSNRGIFSCIATTFSKKIISMDLNKKYEKSIKQNMILNKFTSFFLENKKVVCDNKINIEYKINQIGINELLHKYKINEPTLIKIDIEGGEEELFINTDWLKYINILIMEVHPHLNVNVQKVIKNLENHNFKIICVDENLNYTINTQSMTFIYAIK